MMARAGFEHGDIASELNHQLRAHVRAHDLGTVTAAETGFILDRDPDTVRAPDVGFVSKSRLAAGMPRGYFPGAPDLAVEINSLSDLASDVLIKVDQWLSAGAVSVWVVDPPTRSVEVYRADKQVVRFHAGDTLTDEPTLPGLKLKIADLFR